MAHTEPRFHVPAPHVRPGDTPDFSHIHIPPAGEARRPDTSVAGMETQDLALGLVRVLDHNHQAVGEWDPKLDAGVLREGLRHMVLTRVYDDRMLKLQRQGKMSFYMKSTGEEAVAVAGAMAMSNDDMVFPSYRQQGILFARGRDIVDMMCHCISNSRDNLKGRQLPVHYTWAEGKFFSISGNLATQLPQAVGYAMACEYRGDGEIAATWIGDGSTAEGDFHGALVLASTYRAPVIVNVVNNQWAISTFQGIAAGEAPTFAYKGMGYGLASLRIDGNDFLAVYAATQWAAKRARDGHGATVIEHFTYRADAHSTSDDPSGYRPKGENAIWPLGDPIERLKQHLIGLGEWDEERHAALEKELNELVIASYKEAESHGTLHDGPLSPVESIFEDVYAEPDWRLRRQRQDLGV
ncbi:3-methyl-2-oxobutanoate dehydrogenase (2-methylpropanoyl-transferring) subunit alpha [Maricaulis maris]|jgi:2-oxoisovalerate dehydrogenase E1 component alpha subunit|uniref:2-oxoisovalerate dehydrogenase subunit alpha n=1 Tax=Maricaulis maris (strain MCS10) TaxID=394221 RepID=Q0ARU0_MARMM|nr:3-methyl-2-oxobutanoate dehydrogenase (2-methylpropanoyl-transferring) subunit alpha [Maricaulis maris]ABI64997.1 branched-chain alpha-keto acid dehydrogenase E1 component [Maricaulis maris MCS10]